MSAFTTTILQSITIGIAIAIDFLFNKSSPKWWKAILGFLVVFAVSWFLCVMIWAHIFVPSDPNAAIIAGMPKSFWFAVVGGAMGMYWGRRNAKQSCNSNT